MPVLTGMMRETTTHSAEETTAFGRTLTELLAPPKLVLLRGDLGAGKTTLIKGIAAGFEAAAEEDVTSPTFTLVHEYRGPRVSFTTSTYIEWILHESWKPSGWMTWSRKTAFS